MAKLSVSVPDELWWQANLVRPDLRSPSKIVQAALHLLVADHEPTDEELREWWNKMTKGGDTNVL